MEVPAVDGLQDFVDLMVDTRTHRDDWYVGTGEIAEALHMQGGDITVTPEVIKRLTVVKNIRPGKYYWMVVARKTEIDALYAERQHAFAAKAAARAQAAAPAAEEGVPSGNGKVPTLILKEGTPLLNREDAKAIIHAQWTATQALKENTAAVNQLASSVDANTKAQRDQIKAMREIFDGQKSEGQA